MRLKLVSASLFALLATSGCFAAPFIAVSEQPAPVVTARYVPPFYWIDRSDAAAVELRPQLPDRYRSGYDWIEYYADDQLIATQDAQDNPNFAWPIHDKTPGVYRISYQLFSKRTGKLLSEKVLDLEIRDRRLVPY